MIIRRYIMSGLAGVAFLMGGISCSDDLRYNDSEAVADSSAEEDDGMVDVTLRFTFDGFGNVATRDDVVEGSQSTYDLTNIDLLIYSLRDEDDNVLTQYGRGVVDYEYTDETGTTHTQKWYERDEKTNKFTSPDALKNYDMEDDNNQTLMKVDWKYDASIDRYKLLQPVKLRVMRNKVYKLSCWAQNSGTEAYDFNYLTAVKINYTNAHNNDQKRDAFCATSIFSIGQVESTIEVTLTRPCAQINVAVEKKKENGEYVENWREDEDYTKFKESSIILNGVATYFNVIENKAWSKEDYDKYPRGPKGKYNEAIFNKAEWETSGGKNYPKFIANEVEFSYYDIIPDELFIHDYSNWNNSDLQPDKKEYCSLSMCYVFVPEATYTDKDNDGNMDDSATAEKPDDVEDDDWDVETGVVSPTLEPIYIYLKSFSVKEDPNSSTEISYPKDGEEPLQLSVKRNWRTNVIFENWDWTKSNDKSDD